MMQGTSGFRIAVVMALSHLAGSAVADEAEDHFEGKVRPLLVETCHRCHGKDQQKGDLRLDSRAAILEGGKSGPAVVSGNPAS